MLTLNMYATYIIYADINHLCQHIQAMLPYITYANIEYVCQHIKSMMTYTHIQIYVSSRTLTLTKVAIQTFQLGSDGQFGEAWQEDFCLITFKSNLQKLLWTHPNRALKTSWWERYDGSAQYDVFIPDAGTRRRVQENFSRLPPWHFPAPTYTPRQQFWSDPAPLEREADNSCW